MLKPQYIIDLNKFRENCLDVTSAFDREWAGYTAYGYSVKTNHDSGLIRFARERLGWFIEVVSPDEYNYCRSLEILPDDMILNGPCKEELLKEVPEPAEYINLDNLDEVIAFVGLSHSSCNVGLRINFNLEESCPGETTAGDEVSRFGIDADSEDLKLAIEMLLDAGYDSIGLHMHYSTKTRSLGVFRALARKAVEIKQQFGIHVPYVDIGGGFFGGQKVEGRPSMEEYARTICDILKTGFEPESTTLILEPGASVLVTCVYYKTDIINVRKIRDVHIVTTNGTLLHINPFMVDRIQPFEVKGDLSCRAVVDKQIVSGATCMENDKIAVLEGKKELRKGDVLIFSTVGAYTMGLNSHFILDPPDVVYIGE